MFEASMNTDSSIIQPLLARVVSIFDDDFGDSHVQQLMDIYDAVPDHEKDMVSLAVTFEGEQEELIFVVNNDGGSRDLHFFSDGESLVNKIQSVYQEFCIEIGT
ncbi:hypothetical protein ACJJIR_05370 [Microbulbifer sp. SSSA008]|uniref:hypothetical protein n=1 Tax=Microbulbifer sp. SSSA008 TaxID=3243380 RepID=UPI0040391645